MFVAAKNLCTQERIYLSADEIVILDDEKKVRRPFCPKDENDFMLRDESYGVIKGSTIERHYLLMMKSSMDKLKSNKKRMGDPKRISNAPAFVKIKDYPLESQKDSRKTPMARKVKDTVGITQKVVQKGIAERFLRARLKEKETETKDNDLTHNDSKKCNQERDETEDASTRTSGDRPEKGIETLPENTTKELPVNQPTEKSRESTRFAGDCCHCAEELLSLKEKCANLKKENEKLQLAAEQSSTLKKMQEDLAALKKSTTQKCSQVPQPACGVNVEPEFAGIDIHDDKIYIGQGKFISRHEFLEAEDHVSFRMRAGALCEAFWPGEVHLYSKTGIVTENTTNGVTESENPKPKKKTQYRRIELLYHLALKTLLRQMSWGNGVDPRLAVTNAKVSRFLTEYPSEVRRNLKKKTEEWENREKRIRHVKPRSSVPNKQKPAAARYKGDSSSGCDSNERNPLNEQHRKLVDRAAKRLKVSENREEDLQTSEESEEERESNTITRAEIEVDDLSD